MPSGRLSKITPEIIDKVADLISKGNYRQVAAAACGISEGTVSNWMKRGKREPGSIYEHFLEAVRGAEQTAEMNCVAFVIAAAENDAKHAEWWLERKFPDRWGSFKREIADLRRTTKELVAKVAEMEAQRTKRTIATTNGHAARN